MLQKSTRYFVSTNKKEMILSSQLSSLVAVARNDTTGHFFRKTGTKSQIAGQETF